METTEFVPVCAVCGRALRSDATEGLCSSCVLEQGLQIVTGVLKSKKSKV